MSDACIPQDPHDRARLARQSYVRMRARMLSIRGRRAGNPAVGTSDTRGGVLSKCDMTEHPSIGQAARRLPMQPEMEGGS